MINCMSAASESQHASHFPRGTAREVTPLSIWGGDTLIYRSIIALSGLAMPIIAAVNWYLRDSLSWPQLGAAGAIFLGATLCFTLAKIGRRDIAAALNQDPRIEGYVIESENFESIHNHSAYAMITGR